MFTGIITDLGRVRRAVRGDGLELTIATAYDIASIELGASICCSGCCLTVVSLEEGAFRVQASGETLSCATLGAWREGTAVNLERSLKLGDEFGGHIVSGHVDGVAEIVSRRSDAESVRFTIRAPAEFAALVAGKGSVALDGISLTVNEISGREFGVNIIPYTLAHTTLGEAQPGQLLNFEIDPIARYVARLLEART
ncbi:MAG TPA: riboflavin synthase [Stellaceae bacterium]|jgi:riboflavin synthase|nr:riboflavin synthase [Stellaceae bacterium]